MKSLELIQDLSVSSWSLFKQHFAFFAHYIIILFLLDVISFWFTKSTFSQNQTNTVLFNITTYIADIFVYYILIKAALKIAHNPHESISSLSLKSSEWIKYLIATTFIVFLTIVGFVLFIIPGLYLITRYFFLSCVLVDKKLSIRESFGESSKMTRNKFFYLLPVAVFSILPIALYFVPSYASSPYLIDLFSEFWVVFTSILTAKLYLKFKS